MLVVTTDSIPGYDIVAVFGAVSGNSVRAFRQGMFGVPLDDVASMSGVNRREAIGRMIADARQSQANAVVGMKMDSLHSAYGFEHCAYGTAVWAVPVSEDAKRLYDAMVHEGRVPPLHQYDEMIRGINSIID